MFGFGSKHYTREQLLDLLRANVCEVTFTKVSDGSERVMKATLNTLFLPEYKQSERTIAENPEVIRVYDVELNDWRSFRVDSVKKIDAIVWPQSDRGLQQDEEERPVVGTVVSASFLTDNDDTPVVTGDSDPVVVGGGGTFDGGGSEGSWSNDSDSGSSDSSSSFDSGSDSSSSDPVDTSSGDNTDDF